MTVDSKTNLNETNLTIVGNGMVCVSFLRQLFSYQKELNFSINVFGEEEHVAYNRIRLSEFLKSDDYSDLYLEQAEWYARKNINLKSGEKIVEIDREQKSIRTEKNHYYSYDKLIFATGSSPYIPNLPGISSGNVITYRNISDLKLISQKAEKADHVVVIGGGLLGVEIAEAIRVFDANITILDRSSGPMAKYLDNEASAILKKLLLSKNINIRTNARTRTIEEASGKSIIHLEDGNSLESDFIILTAGVKPRDELARESQLEIGPKGGIVINEHLLTNDPNIYAIGDCVSFNNITYGLIEPGRVMGDVLAHNLTHKKKKSFQHKSFATTITVDEKQITTAGEFQSNQRSITFQDKETYIKLVLEKGHLLGAVMIGKLNESNRILNLVDTQKRISNWKLNRFKSSGYLYKPKSGSDSPINWPDKTTICNCLNISKQEILQCKASNAPCPAGTICGSCQPLVRALQNNETVTTEKTPFPVRAFFITSIIVFIGIVSLILAPPIKAPDTVQINFNLYDLIQSNIFKQITGFSVVFLILIGMAVSLRKRFKLLKLISFDSFRFFHAFTGLLGVFIICLHTGFKLGENFNFVLMMNYICLSIIGAVAGIATTLNRTHINQLTIGLKKLTTIGHIMFVWPFPVLLVYHVVMVYFY